VVLLSLQAIDLVAVGAFLAPTDRQPGDEASG